jgi:quinol-cytochrome oxidoreductase complex cytochrome b subunit
MTVVDKNQEDTIPFYPDHIRTEFYVTIGVAIVVGVIGIVGFFTPLGLGVPADPMNTPAHVKPEWYFLSLYQLLKFIPKNVGTIAPLLIVALLIIWPFIDRKPDTSKKNTRIRFIVSALIVTVLALLTIWGEVS